MSIRKPNRIIEEFIQLYKSEPCLWRVKSKEYHDRPQRDAAYAKLVTKLRELEPDAVKDTVVKKINNLRSNVRKEKKKYEASRRSGAAGDELCKPTLWYYNLFDFLGDQDVLNTSNSNLKDGEKSGSDDDDVKEPRVPPSHFLDTNEAVDDNYANTRPNPKKKKKSDDDLTTDVLMSVRNHFKKPPAREDRYDLIGKTIAMKLRGLENRQCLVAEKMINDILFEAEMGSLSTTSHQNSSGYMDHQLRTPFTGHSITPSPTSYSDTNPSPPFQFQTVLIPEEKFSASHHFTEESK